MEIIDYLMNVFDVFVIDNFKQVLALVAALSAGNVYCIIKIVKMQVRLNMHASHFDVLDDTHSNAQKDASRALEHASYSKGCSDTIIKIIKKK